jgi:hypothetical protein
MATFNSLFDFPDFSDDQSELFSPLDFSDSDESVCSKATENKEDA